MFVWKSVNQFDYSNHKNVLTSRARFLFQYSTKACLSWVLKGGLGGEDSRAVIWLCYSNNSHTILCFWIAFKKTLWLHINCTKPHRICLGSSILPVPTYIKLNISWNVCHVLWGSWLQVVTAAESGERLVFWGFVSNELQVC